MSNGNYPPNAGETLRVWRLGFDDTGSGGLTVEPVSVGPFTIDLANWYMEIVFGLLKALPEGNRREWRIMMRDINPTGDFPEGAEIDWPCVELPKLPIAAANAKAEEVINTLKPQPAWGGSRAVLPFLLAAPLLTQLLASASLA